LEKKDFANLFSKDIFFFIEKDSFVYNLEFPIYIYAEHTLVYEEVVTLDKISFTSGTVGV